MLWWVFLVAQMVKNQPAMQETWKIPWRRSWQPTPILLPGEFHRQSLAGYSPWGHKKSDTTKRLTLSMLLLEFRVTEGEFTILGLYNEAGHVPYCIYCVVPFLEYTGIFQKSLPPLWTYIVISMSEGVGKR